MTECNLALIVSEILSGKVVIFPTETSYGLGCDATNQEAVDRIFQIKGRSDNKPLLVVVDSVQTARKYLFWNYYLDQMAQSYWPGPLTVVGRYAMGNLAKGVVGPDETLAVRVTDFSLLKSITEKIGRPLVATSANLAGEPSLYSANELIKVFENREHQPDILLDFGDLERRPNTTMVSAIGAKMSIIRQGGLDVKI